jgi:hypothetical protein
MRPTVREESFDLLTWEVARRCQCDRPSLIADEDGMHCMKCGRLPTVRLGPGAMPPGASPVFVRELGRV